MTTVTEPTRRHLSPRQAELVDRLIEAAADEARERGYEGVSVRSAAKRAELAPATAYTYFASKDHLLAEALWRRLDSLPPVETDPSLARLERVIAELGRLGTFMAEDPELAAACTTALLGAGTDVRLVRDRFGARIVSRISAALGDSPSTGRPQAGYGSHEQILRTLNLALVGAMLSAGMGHLTFADVPQAMAEAATLLIGADR
jgi:AcrR family transcriptional regulator